MFSGKVKKILLVCTTCLFLVALFSGVRLLNAELPPIQTRVMMYSK
jgi:hypothetical protein